MNTTRDAARIAHLGVQLRGPVRVGQVHVRISQAQRFCRAEAVMQRVHRALHPRQRQTHSARLYLVVYSERRAATVHGDCNVGRLVLRLLVQALELGVIVDAVVVRTRHTCHDQLNVDASAPAARRTFAEQRSCACQRARERSNIGARWCKPHTGSNNNHSTDVLQQACRATV